LSNLLYDLVKGAIMSAPVILAIKYGFGFLKDRSQVLILWAGGSIALAFALFFFGATGSFARSEPDFSASIDRVQTFEASGCLKPMQLPNSDPDDVYLVVTASIRNSGSPSIADGWSLSVQPLFGPILKPEGLYLPDTISLVTPDGKRTMSYLGKDGLYNKALEHPVGQGAFVRGLLMYRVKGSTVPVLSQPGTTYELTYADILGHAQTIQWIWPAISPYDQFGYLPGLSVGPEGPAGPSLPSGVPTPKGTL
jgi:hypothetical protein